MLPPFTKITLSVIAGPTRKKICSFRLLSPCNSGRTGITVEFTNPQKKKRLMQRKKESQPMCVSSSEVCHILYPRTYLFPLRKTPIRVFGCFCYSRHTASSSRVANTVSASSSPIISLEELEGIHFCCSEGQVSSKLMWKAGLFSSESTYAKLIGLLPAKCLI